MQFPSTKIRKTFSWLVLAALVYLSLELVSLAGLALLRQWKSVDYQPAITSLSEESRQQIRSFITGRTMFRVLDESLGWTNRPDAVYSKPGNEALRPGSFHINGQGLRGSAAYSLTPAAGIRRILAFGDSFTFGLDVDDHQCWAALLGAGDPSLETINFGVPGFALDQSLLRYREEGPQFKPAIVLMGFMTENIKRHVNVFRPFLYSSGFPAAKPRFRLENGLLVLQPNPLPTPAHYRRLLENEGEMLTRLGRHDHFQRTTYPARNYDLIPSVRLWKVLQNNFRATRGAEAFFHDGRLNSGSEAFRVTVRIFAAFADEADDDGAHPVALIFPRLKDVRRYQEEGCNPCAPLLDALARHGIDAVDLMEVLAAGDQPEQFYASGGHLSIEGNEAVVRHLRQWLGEQGLI